MNGLQYWVAVEPQDAANADFGVVVPDLPGCYAQAGTLEAALEETRASVAGWMELCRARGEVIPEPSDLPALKAAHPEWQGWRWERIEAGWG